MDNLLKTATAFPLPGLNPGITREGKKSITLLLISCLQYYFKSFCKSVALQNENYSKVITLLYTCICQVLALLLCWESQYITLLYGQEITSIATA